MNINILHPRMKLLVGQTVRTPERGNCLKRKLNSPPPWAFPFFPKYLCQCARSTRAMITYAPRFILHHGREGGSAPPSDSELTDAAGIPASAPRWLRGKAAWLIFQRCSGKSAVIGIYECAGRGQGVGWIEATKAHSFCLVFSARGEGGKKKGKCNSGGRHDTVSSTNSQLENYTQKRHTEGNWASV